MFIYRSNTIFTIGQKIGSYTLAYCDALRDLVSVIIWRFHGRSNVCECILTLFSTFMSFSSVCMSQNGIRTGLLNVKRLNAIQTGKHQQSNDVSMLHLISQYHENCNTMSPFTVYVMDLGTLICSAVQCFHQFVIVSIYCLLSFFSDAAAYSDHSYLVEIVVERSIFECNIQNFVKFIKREQHSWRSVTFGKDAGFQPATLLKHSCTGVFHVSRIVQKVPNCAKHH